LNLQAPTTFTNKFIIETMSKLAQSMDKVIDPSKCPICGEPYQCAQEFANATGRP
jgi:hypothetical protein